VKSSFGKSGNERMGRCGTIKEKRRAFLRKGERDSDHDRCRRKLQDGGSKHANWRSEEVREKKEVGGGESAHGGGVSVKILGGQEKTQRCGSFAQETSRDTERDLGKDIGLSWRGVQPRPFEGGWTRTKS